jgi:hypothetical protein
MSFTVERLAVLKPKAESLERVRYLHRFPAKVSSLTFTSGQIPIHEPCQTGHRKRERLQRVYGVGPD